MAFGLKKNSKEPMSEINVTPFVDVMLVLLIVFMITAPLLTSGVSVDLPNTDYEDLPGLDVPLTITINKIMSLSICIRVCYVIDTYL